MQETDDPKLFARLYREILIITTWGYSEVDIVVKGETKSQFGGFIFPGDEDEYLAFYEAQYVLWPNETVLRKLEKIREAKAEGTPFHLIDWDYDEEEGIPNAVLSIVRYENM